MTTTPFASPEARYLAAPLKPSSPLSVRTVRTTLPAPEPPIAHHSVEEPSSSPLSSIEYVSDDDREDTSNAANDYPGDVSKTAQYRSPRILPFELYQHCLVYFEEQLYGKAITLLNNLLVSFPSSNEAFSPTPNQIAFINTLLVHPLYTTRASPGERVDVSSQSLVLLRNILSILGPSNAKLCKAFTFTRNVMDPRRNRRGEQAIRKDRQYHQGNFSYGEERMNSKLANDGSLWTRAQDFWQVVGWAFNCSIKHRERWNTWKVWLNYMIDVIEADWKELPNLNDKKFTAKQYADPEAMHEVFQDRILVQYISAGSNYSTALRRIVKSVFVDGSIDAVKAYPMVFENETRKEAPHSGLKRKRAARLDLNEDKYGDYYENEDEESGVNTPDPSWPTDSIARGSDTPSTASMADDPEAVTLRLRILALLSLASFTCPTLFVPCSDLYDVVVSLIQPLPLPEFSLFMSAAAFPHLPASALSSIVQGYLHRLLPWSAPRPEDDDLTQPILERCFLPFAANTSSIEDNAKVSISVETLLRLLTTTSDIDPTPELMEAVNGGIAAREKKCNSIGRKTLSGVKGNEDLYWLRSSAERIGFMLEFVQARQATANELAETTDV